MNNGVITWQALLAGVGLVGTVFTLYKNYWEKPQETLGQEQNRLDKKQAVGQTETIAKAEALALVLKADKESNERRFAEIGASIEKSFTLALNHSHTVEEAVKALTKVVTDSNLATTNTITRLSTIIEERIPKK